MDDFVHLRVVSLAKEGLLLISCTVCFVVNGTHFNYYFESIKSNSGSRLLSQINCIGV